MINSGTDVGQLGLKSDYGLKAVLCSEMEVQLLQTLIKTDGIERDNEVKYGFGSYCVHFGVNTQGIFLLSWDAFNLLISLFSYYNCLLAIQFFR